MYVLISFLHYPTNIFSVDAVDWRFVAFIGYLIYKVLLFWCKYKTIKLYVQYLNVMIFIFVIIVFLSLKNHNVLKTWKIKSLRIFWNAEINFNFCSFYCVKKTWICHQTEWFACKLSCRKSVSGTLFAVLEIMGTKLSDLGKNEDTHSLRLQAFGFLSLKV